MNNQQALNIPSPSNEKKTSYNTKNTILRTKYNYFVLLFT